ncbi:redoxin domain-containing protein [Zafaria cholistanensis]|uniref:redoxin domain-containing protein n=1 Tax=Zafaria cholistanensis TaxID=1682741 RepID=UPI00155A5912|nr:redoxin domain-containing protein [Zafaria cholistanensis]
MPGPRYDAGPAEGAAVAAGARPQPGDAVPEFLLENQYGERLGPGREGGLGEGDYFVVFFPFAFSRVCTGELEALEALRPELQSRGVRILAVSVDHKYALRAYAQELGLGFDLLADFWPHGATATAFGCFDAVRGMATRSTFLVSGGRVAARFATPVGQGRDPEDYRRAVERLRAGDRPGAPD